MVLNCAGPWLRELAGDIGGIDGDCLARAVNIVVNRNFFGRYAVGLEGSSEFVDPDALVQGGRRLFFFVPWRGKTMIGTTYAASSADGLVDSFTDDIRSMIAEINRIYPPARLNLGDVTYCHCGLVPAYASPAEDGGGEPCLRKHTDIIDHEEQGGLQGMLSVRGVKYTTAMGVARQLQRIIAGKNLAGQRRRQPAPAAQSRGAAASGPGQDGHLERFAHLAEIYGDRAPAIFQIMDREPGTAGFISTSPPLTRAEILYAVREEMAASVADIVFRRTGLGSGHCPLRQVLEEVAAIMAVELGWSGDETVRQVEDVLHIYGRMSVPLP
jgi:glycerol-3-phosphate dehydrogenase